jgi:glutamyl-tRNA reductase
MRTFVVGCNHRTAPVEIRERLSLDSDGCTSALAAFREAYPDAETVILSTCNRTELYVSRPLQSSPQLQEAVDLLARQQGIDSREFASHLYVHEDGDAVRHLFRVVASLDSMVVGESQILGQAKQALAIARTGGAARSALDAMFRHAFTAAKQVHSETQISEGHVSIGTVALDFAAQIFTRFDDKVVLMIGAGEMGELTVKHIMGRQPRRVLVTNRTAERAREVADRLGAEARPFETLDDLLVEADIVLTCTGSPEAILTRDRFPTLPRRRRYRSLLMIDMAVPRDIDESMGELESVFVYNIDDLQRITERQVAQRQTKVARGEKIVEEHVQTFMLERGRREVGPVVAELRESVQAVAERELKWLTPKLQDASEKDRELISHMVSRLVNKILHRPIQTLNDKGREGRGQIYAEAARRLFGLDPDD